MRTENRHRTDIEPVGPDPHQMIQDAGHFIEQDPYILRPQWRLHTQQFFNCEYIGVLIAHHGNVIQAVHVAYIVIKGFAFGQFLRASVKQPDVRIEPLDYLAIHLHHDA